MKTISQGRQEFTLQLWHAPNPPHSLNGALMKGGSLIERQRKFHCRILAKLGMSVKTICSYTHLTEGQVTYELHKERIKVRDYRQGVGEYARLVLERTGPYAARLLAAETKQRGQLLDARTHSA